MPSPAAAAAVAAAVAIVREGEVVELEPGADLIADVGLDSVDLVNLMVAIEADLGATFDEAEFLSAVTVADICDLIEAAR